MLRMRAPSDLGIFTRDTVRVRGRGRFAIELTVTDLELPAAAAAAPEDRDLAGAYMDAEEVWDDGIASKDIVGADVDMEAADGSNDNDDVDEGNVIGMEASAVLLPLDVSNVALLFSSACRCRHLRLRGGAVTDITGSWMPHSAAINLRAPRAVGGIRLKMFVGLKAAFPPFALGQSGVMSQ